jgi:ubiquinone biosynthesis protein UbiJ
MLLNRHNNTSKSDLFRNNFATHINKILGFDRDENRQMLELNGRLIQVILNKVDLKFHFLISNNRLTIGHGQVLDPDVTVTGSPADFLDLFKSRFRTKSIAADTVQISGDLGVAKQVEDLIKEIEFDGEELLSKIVGDIPSHMIFHRLSIVKSDVLRAISKVETDLIDYIQYEKDLVPSSENFSDFATQVSSLSERLEFVKTQVKIIEETVPRAV